MNKSVADRWQERNKTLGALEVRKKLHKYLDDALALLATLGTKLAALEPKIGFSDADAHDMVVKREQAAKDLPVYLQDLRKLSTLGLHGAPAHDAVLHYVLHGDMYPPSFPAKEAALVYAVGALTGGTEKWQKDALARGNALLTDLRGATADRFETGKGQAQAHADYKAAAAEWDNLYEAVKGLVSAAAHLLNDAALYDALIYTHPRHLPAQHPAPAPQPVAAAK